MSLWLGSDREARAQIAATTLAPLAHSLRSDLEPLVTAREILLPAEKARLTRLGGRCPKHAVLLEFDPWSPRAHRCPACGDIFREDEHYRWWVMNYQLWLAERAVHAAALLATTRDEKVGRVCARILERCADAYLQYPNKDNVLGPTRPFFSTYLESIWLLQLCVALDVYEAAEGKGTLGAHVRERLVEPSVALIAEYDEGSSNRQVWNNAALIAAGSLLERPGIVARALDGRSGLLAHLETGLLEDGSWYEGENYHQFAHRGLWYGVTAAERLGWQLPTRFSARFHEAFVLPFGTALPDFTFPARKDSQYGVSLRQWRYAESCELGLTRRADPRLRAALQELYRGDVPPGETGRKTSTAEAERNLPPARLSRADLGWKSLLYALRQHPAPTGSFDAKSLHLEAQGLAIFRRQRGQAFVALDYGAPGGGHGHPDRLNLWVVADGERWLEDVGTGSYVDKSLFWYRSTLAHNAPLANGVSQPYGSGILHAYEEGESAGWIEASFELVPGRTRVTRRVVVLDGYLIDEVRWRSADPTCLDLPFHVDMSLGSERTFAPAELVSSLGSGFDFLRDVEASNPGVSDACRVTRGGASLRGWMASDTPHVWYRAMAPGAPGRPPGRMYISRAMGREGRLRTVWSWADTVDAVRFTPETVALSLRSGEVHAHRLIRRSWRMRFSVPGGPPREVGLEGWRTLTVTPESTSLQGWGSGAEAPHHMLAAGRPFSMELGERHYRRSEQPWANAGAPKAILQVAAGVQLVDIDIRVFKEDPVFAPHRSTNALDNEDPDINSDGVQLYLYLPDSRAHASWLLVPEPGGHLRATLREAGGDVPPLNAEWRLTSDGYRVRVSLPRGSRGLGVDRHFMLNVVINEISRDRERRRGQLIATGADSGGGEWVYLRGDREDPKRMLAFEIVDD